MFWTQVVQVKEPLPEPIPVFDLEKDLQKDRMNQAIRMSVAREILPFLFEPDDFKANRSEMTAANYQLSQAELLEQAKAATAIMRAISERVHNLTEEGKLREEAPLTGLQLALAIKEQQPEQLCQADFTEQKNPAHPRAKKRTLR